jgi:AcrR family transcriptional regulator
VSRMTVFNYFPRKEDLFFDRTPELTALITSGVRDRPAGQEPEGALRDVFLRLLDEGHPLGGFADRFTGFWQVIIDSPALRARVRELGEEFETLIAGLLAEGGDPRPALTAALVTAAYRTCYADAARRIMAGTPGASFFDEHRARLARAFDCAAVAAAAIDPVPNGG